MEVAYVLWSIYVPQVSNCGSKWPFCQPWVSPKVINTLPYRNYIKPVPPTYNFIPAPILGLTGWYRRIQKIPAEINLPVILSGKLQSGRFVNFTKANPLKYGFPSSIPSSHSRKPYCASSLPACWSISLSSDRPPASRTEFCRLYSVFNKNWSDEALMGIVFGRILPVNLKNTF